MNPYLAIAASLASGIYGIEHKLALKGRVGGNAYSTAMKEDSAAKTTAIGGSSSSSASSSTVAARDQLPRNLWEAAKRMEESALAKELFGEAFVDHFTSTRKWEWRQFQSSVTNWELERYLEII